MTTQPQSIIPLPLWILVPLGIVVIPILPFLSAYSKSKKKFEDWKKKDPPVRPLRRNRKRALTLPLPKASYSGRKAQRTYDQSQSLFLNRLSSDIRLIIYEYVLAPPGDQVLHVAAISGRLYGIRCYETDPTRPAWKHKCWESSDLIQDHPRYPKSSKFLSLLYSCRQIYSEAVNILYTKNILSVQQTRAVLNFPHVMLPHRLALIRKLNIDLLIYAKVILGVFLSYEWPKAFTKDWKSLCQVLFKMGTCGLQRLEITLKLCGSNRREFGAWATDDELALLLDSLMGIQVREFSVFLQDWPQCKEDVLRILGSDPPLSIENR
ncbi:hypothetical protein N7474_010128 [Penicillium riverlandense]|uniref:uncharacterized protein n=1 Tax=Penicillium riverlandense TaxID=1903569 RepID=UPI002548A69C|nr:uncharacterized protein N7474_010128 [Penicillium riverlandense]KAJ5808859.1 hypothetical protein N7474_010128 [Penicillium riverlandense]